MMCYRLPLLEWQHMNLYLQFQRRRLAEKAKAVGRSVLATLGTIVTPDTLLRWYRRG